MIAASAADIDGLSILFGQNAYWTYHHTFGHNLFYALVLSPVLTAFSTRRMFSFCLYLAMAHLHVLLDYLGSGPGRAIHYLWPVPGWTWVNPFAWPFYSWQNISVFLALLGWTIAIARVRGISPLEIPFPRLDAKAVAWLRRGRTLNSSADT